MKRKTILKSIVIILLVVEVISLYLLSKPDNKVVLDDVLTMPLKNKRQTLAVMVQQEDNTWKEAENRNAWPSSTTHGFVGSRCYDGNGASVESTDIIQFDLSTYTATINTTSSIYCTLYFAKGTPALDLLQQKGRTTFASGNLTSVDGMYRFKGTSTQVLNNYICFGTTLENECLNKPEIYMYRIIGMTSTQDNTVTIPANSLKIIKATPSNKSQRWYDSNTSDIKWDASSAKSSLQTFYNETFIIEGTKKLSNASYWDSIILNHSWYNADYTNISVEEPKTSHTLESKISLIYGTDYANAGPYDYTSGKNNWLFIKNSWSTNSTLSTNELWEWTMSRYGAASSGPYTAWRISTDGDLNNGPLAGANSIRPVFYLQAGVNLTGEGTKENPFIISGVMPQS